jgi:hypothetical protein
MDCPRRGTEGSWYCAELRWNDQNANADAGHRKDWSRQPRLIPPPGNGGAQSGGATCRSSSTRSMFSSCAAARACPWGAFHATITCNVASNAGQEQDTLQPCANSTAAPSVSPHLIPEGAPSCRICVRSSGIYIIRRDDLKADNELLLECS